MQVPVTLDDAPGHEVPDSGVKVTLWSAETRSSQLSLLRHNASAMVPAEPLSHSLFARMVRSSKSGLPFSSLSRAQQTSLVGVRPFKHGTSSPPYVSSSSADAVQEPLR